MNLVTLVGNVGKDAEMKGAMCVFTVATNDGYGDNKKTNWHSIKCFKQNAEFAAKYVKKGAKIAVTGSIDYSESNGKFYTNINCNNFELLDKRDGDNSSDVPF